MVNRNKRRELKKKRLFLPKFSDGKNREKEHTGFFSSIKMRFSFFTVVLTSIATIFGGVVAIKDFDQVKRVLLDKANDITLFVYHLIGEECKCTIGPGLALGNNFMHVVHVGFPFKKFKDTFPDTIICFPVPVGLSNQTEAPIKDGELTFLITSEDELGNRIDHDKSTPCDSEMDLSRLGVREGLKRDVVVQFGNYIVRYALPDNRNKEMIVLQFHYDYKESAPIYHSWDNARIGIGNYTIKTNISTEENKREFLFFVVTHDVEDSDELLARAVFSDEYFVKKLIYDRTVFGDIACWVASFGSFLDSMCPYKYEASVIHYEPYLYKGDTARARPVSWDRRAIIAMSWEATIDKVMLGDGYKNNFREKYIDNYKQIVEGIRQMK
ncbi:hypothetical protein ACJ41P_20815 [Azospirillum argentinense]|uniref:Uncharacterized protein n=1 Tax=Azospirillum argentinense TaxID=2970906 RepID=A0ABW8VB28_9PROT